MVWYVLIAAISAIQGEFRMIAKIGLVFFLFVAMTGATSNAQLAPLPLMVQMQRVQVVAQITPKVVGKLFGEAEVVDTQPVVGAMVYIVDEKNIVRSVRLTDHQGLTFLPRIARYLPITVAAEGYTVHKFEVQSTVGEPTIKLVRQSSRESNQ